MQSEQDREVIASADELAREHRRRAPVLVWVAACLWICGGLGVLAMTCGCSAAAATGSGVKMSADPVPTLPLALVVGDEMPLEFQLAAGLSANYWNCALGSEVFADRALDVWMIATPGMLTRWTQSDGLWVLEHLTGRVNRAHRIIRLGAMLFGAPSGFIEQTLRHELGHLLGLGDADAYPDIMHPGQRPCPEHLPGCDTGALPLQATPEQLAALRRLHGLKAPPYDPGRCGGATLYRMWPYDWLRRTGGEKK
jgi:hypothetical protein